MHFISISLLFFRIFFAFYEGKNKTTNGEKYWMPRSSYVLFFQMLRKLYRTILLILLYEFS